MDNIKRAAEIITEWADKTIWANQLQCTTKEAFAFARLAKFAKEPEPERKAGELTREQAMIAYCSGEEVEVSNGRVTVVASVVGQAPKIDGKHGGIPLFCNEDLSFRIAPKHPKLVDGLTACKAYRDGKKVARYYYVYQKGSAGPHPDFTLDGWEIID